MSRLRTTVIVPSAGRMAMLHRCLDSLATLDVRPDATLVVLQGTPDADRAAEIVSTHPGVAVVWSARRGAAAARNAGAARADADLLLFVDDDCVVDRQWLSCYRAAFSAERTLSAAGGRVLAFAAADPEAVPLGLQQSTTPRLIGRWSNPVGSIDRSGNLAVTAEAFRALRGFDEGLGAGTIFPSAEDTDFVYRALRAGFRLRYLPGAIVFHDQWRTAGEAAAVERGYGLGLGAFLVTHVRAGDLYALGLVARLLWRLGIRPLVGGVAAGRRQRRRSGWSYLVGIPLGMVKGVRRPTLLAGAP